MMNSDKAVEYFQSLNPSLFDVLDRFEVRQTKPDEDSKVQLIVEIWLRVLLDEEEDLRRLHLTFFGVRDLKFQAQGLVKGFELSIRSIKDYQWEGLRYEVHDKESLTPLSFYCWRFEADLITL
jgi:hypothetical protein